MMHYHGTPITPRAKLLELVGCAFCVPYTTPTDLEVCHEIGQSVMLDNGAFSIWQKVENGKKLDARLVPPSRGDWSGYYEWVAPWLDYWTTWAIIPDVIVGDEDDNDALIAEWPFGKRGAPVWHMHEALDRLDRLVSEWPLVCIGSSGDYSKVGSPRWHERMADAMDVACDAEGRTRTPLHMLRGLALRTGPYPFASADSTGIARNHAGAKTRGTPPKDPRRMARDIDGRQCPPRWRRPATVSASGMFDDLALSGELTPER